MDEDLLDIGLGSDLLFPDVEAPLEEADPLSLVMSNLGGASGFSQQAASLREMAAKREREAAELLQASREKKYGPDTSELFGQALAAFMPALVGRAIGGKALGAAGGQLGFDQSAMKQKEFAQEAKEEKALDIAQSEQLGKEAEGLGRQAQLLERDAAFQVGRDADRAATKDYRDKQLGLSEERNRIAASRGQGGGSGPAAPSASDIRSQTKERTALEQRKIQGLNVIPGAVPNSEDAKIASKIWQAKVALDVPFEAAEKALLAGDRAGMGAALARIVINIKNVDGMGANFTQMERRLVDAGLPPFNDYTASGISEYFRKNALQYGNSILKATREGLGNEVKAALATRKYYVPDSEYDPSFVAFGVPLQANPAGKTVAQKSEAYDDYINTLYPDARGIGFQVPNVSPEIVQKVTSQTADERFLADMNAIIERNKKNKGPS